MVIDWYWKIVNLPQVPNEITDMIYKFDPSKIQYRVPPKTEETDTFYIDGKVYKDAIYSRYHSDQPVYEWYFKNVIRYVKDKQTQVAPGVQILSDGTAFHFHTDGKARPYVLNYMLDLGGDNVETVFGQEPVFPITREPFLNKFHCEEYNILDRTVLPNNTWVILNSKVLHGVINMERPRICLSMGITNEEMVLLTSL